MVRSEARRKNIPGTFLNSLSTPSLSRPSRGTHTPVTPGHLGPHFSEITVNQGQWVDSCGSGKA